MMNSGSKAFIPRGRMTIAWTGAVNGGKTEAYLKLPPAADKRINQDLAKGVIALHDEMHINWYALTHPHYRLLDASFCYFEDYPLMFDFSIHLRLKSHYFDVDTFKKDPPKSQLTP